MRLIYHITFKKDFLAATGVGEYRADSLESQGFIHFSQKHQILSVANSFYAGRKDLVILIVDAARLKPVLKFEAPVHPGAAAVGVLPAEDQLFPHLYGPLNLDAVVGVVDFPPSDDGQFELPAM